MQQNLRPRRAAITAALLSTVLLCTASILAQAPQPNTPAMHSRVDAIIARMTLQQKLEYIGGTGFAKFGILVGDSSGSLGLKGSVEVSKEAAASATF